MSVSSSYLELHSGAARSEFSGCRLTLNITPEPLTNHAPRHSPAFSSLSTFNYRL